MIRRSLVALCLLAALATADAGAQEAPARAAHDDRVRYGWPFPAHVSRFCIKGIGDEPTHVGRGRHAWDFILPMRTPVLAAREGVVVRLRDGSTEWGSTREALHQANLVEVQHADGTFAHYGHLSPGVAVAVGQRVERGEVLGYSGNTGWTAGMPHLHFHVGEPDAALGWDTVRVRFGPRGIVPRQGELYGDPPPTNTPMHIRIDGRLVRGRQPIALRRGESVQLRVELGGVRGRRDVTDDPRTEYHAVNPLSLHVEPSGRVHARPSPGFEQFAGRLPDGLLVVSHGRQGDPQIARRRIAVRFVE